MESIVLRITAEARFLYVGIGKTLQVDQGEHLPLAERQALDFRTHAPSKLRGGRGLLGRCAVLRFDVFERVHTLVLASATMMVLEAVGQDRAQPALQPFAIAQLRLARERTQQRFLGEVVGERRVVAPGIGQPEEHLPAVLETPAKLVRRAEKAKEWHRG